jgi:predicted O-methyltransferase YrrM
LGARALAAETARTVLATLETLAPDDYLRYVTGFFRAGLDRFGDAWRYADITTALAAAAALVKPTSYLEIGVRRGRSMAVVAAACPDCSLLGFDLWIEGYAGMDNPGPELVRAELARVGHRGPLELIDGDSHQTVRRYLRQHPDSYFDLITVDGDHSERGAAQDLADVLPRLKVGGVLVFDDTVHPEFPHLAKVWQREVGRHPDMRCWSFGELGFGVSAAIRTA